MKEISQRLRRALAFLQAHGYAKNESEVARMLDVLPSTLNMAKTGRRPVGSGMILKFCEHYPISISWLRTGEGSMIRCEEKEVAKLIEIIDGLDNYIDDLERSVGELETLCSAISEKASVLKKKTE